jgi:hypothetical protein
VLEKMMRRNVLFNLVSSAIVCLALAGISEASVPRAFVSTGGSDANPCSAAQPCRSFNQALTVVEPGGEIVVQNSGGYSTGFTITQSVTIDAAGFNASVISTSTTDLCTINAGPSDRVVLRGISFHGANIGASAINATRVGSLYVEHCSIAEFVSGDGVFMPGGDLWVTGLDVRKCANGLELVTTGATAANLVAQDSRFTECGDGVLVRVNGPAGATGWLSNCTASLCVVGFQLLSFTAASGDLTLTNCRAFGNTGTALAASTASTGNATIRMTNCVVTQNDEGISAVSSGAGTAAVLGTNHGVSPKPGIPPFPGNNLIAGNRFGNAVSSTTTLQ